MSPNAGRAADDLHAGRSPAAPVEPVVTTAAAEVSVGFWGRSARWGLFFVVAAVTCGYLADGLGAVSDFRAASLAKLTRATGLGDLQAVPEKATSVDRTADGERLDPVLPEETQSSDKLGQSSRANVIGEITADLDAEFARYWEQASLPHADPADWLTVCRRLALALVGTGMSLEEIRWLETLPESQRVVAYRERLLGDKRFADYWAERFARSVVGAEDGPFLVYRRRRFVTWLSDQIATNQPYDQIVRQLITSQGYFTDRPAVNFVTVTMDSGEKDQPDPIRLAGRTTRAFLGMRIDCLQCHDDFLGTMELGPASQPRMGSQQDFHQLAAFFSDTRFNILQGIRTEDHPYEYTYLYDEESTTVEPQVPFLPELLPSEGTRTERLATWVTHPRNRQTARALSNRLWALLFGQPLHAPVDDIPLHGPLPPGLDRLADAVDECDWDLRQLVRAITDTQVFQLDSRAEFEITEAHERAWAVFPLVRLRPEQVAGSVMQASRLTTIDDAATFILQLIAFGSENDFVQRYGDTGEDEFDQENITITQRLLMMNGKMVRERTESNPILNASTHIRMFAPDGAKAVETVYLTVLNRRPTDSALETFTQRLQAGEDRQQVIEDLYWMLLNSSELAWNH